MIYRTGCPSRGCHVVFPPLSVAAAALGTHGGNWEEQCTVVFALIVTEPVSEYVCVWGGGRGSLYPPSDSVTIYAKTTVLCSPDSSMDTQFPSLVEDSVLH